MVSSATLYDTVAIAATQTENIPDFFVLELEERLEFYSVVTTTLKCLSPEPLGI